MSPPPAPIIVIRKKSGGHGGHHGGAWKVAYADFVTAMMALFIVLWLMNTDKEVQDSVSAFFRDPSGSGKLQGVAQAGLGNAVHVSKGEMARIKEKLEEALRTMPQFAKLKDQVEMTVTGDGLRIELLETEAGMFFESGRPNPTAAGTELLGHLATELGKMPNRVLIEGHTDARPFSSEGVRGYSNWELSADRANSARKLMQQSGMRPEQVAQVRGFADQQLRRPAEPNHASNRRVTVIVQYLTGAGEADEDEEEGEEAKSEAKKEAAPAKEKTDGHGKPAAHEAAPAPGHK